MRARDNPFSTDRVLSVRYRPQGWSWDALMRRLARLDYRCAVVGPEGRGKTTLLEDLGDRIVADHGLNVKWLRLTREAPSFDRRWLREFFAGVTPRDVLLFDGAEQMGRLAWWNFLRKARRARGLVITSHTSGLLPTLVECETNEALFHTIVWELVGERADELPVRDLFERHRGNVREALRALYDCCASRSDPFARQQRHPGGGLPTEGFHEGTTRHSSPRSLGSLPLPSG